MTPSPYNLCVGCPRVAGRGSNASRYNCQTYRMCLRRHEQPQQYALTLRDRVERAIGWVCLGFMIGWATCRLIPGGL